MAIKPILFNTEMVRAILDGRKSCTRRVIKPQPQSRLCYTYAGSHNGCIGKWTYPNRGAHEFWGEEYKLPENIKDEELSKQWNPPYQTDDILYVRETWGYPIFLNSDKQYVFRADKIAESGFKNDSHIWYPSTNMPKGAARIWLKVTDVRVERLQEITADSIRNEGLSSLAVHCGDIEIALKEWENFWNSTIKKSDLDRYGWGANPWVWVIEFERCKKPEEDKRCD
jgi:hypothetical protein